MASNITVDTSAAKAAQGSGHRFASQGTSDSAYGRWLLTTLAFIALLAMVTAVVNWRLDVLGLFGRDNVSRYSLDRYSTYAMSYRYIPQHYDGLLLGSSLTANWDTSLIPGYRVFNCSMRGANFSEENLIAQNVLVHGNPKMMIILLHPSFTSSHGRLTPYITPEEYWSSFGSLQMLTIYTQMAMERLAGPHTKRWTFQHRAFPFGGENFRIPDRSGPANEPEREFHLDDAAEKELIGLIATAHKRRIQLYFLVPPTYVERWQIDGKRIQAYYDRMLKLVSPEDRVINLNDGSLHELTQNHAAFPDYTHLTLSGARLASEVLAARIGAAEHAALNGKVSPNNGVVGGTNRLTRF